MITVFIYTLTNPLNNEIFYIGRATSLSSRLYIHIYGSSINKSRKNGIIQELLSNGLQPVIEELDAIVCKNASDEEFVNKTEAYWIDQFRSWGFDLTNISGVKRKYKDRLRIKWESHDKEYDWLLSEKDRIERLYTSVYNRTIPKERNTLLGRKVWALDQKKELDKLVDMYRKVVSGINAKKEVYYNQ